MRGVLQAWFRKFALSNTYCEAMASWRHMFADEAGLARTASSDRWGSRSSHLETLFGGDWPLPETANQCTRRLHRDAFMPPLKR